MTSVSEKTDTIFLLFVFSVLVLTWLCQQKRKPRLNLPPGPTPFPWLGNIPQLFRHDFLGVLKKYRPEYGDIFSFRIFNTLFIVLNGYDTIREALVKNADVFSERPPLKIKSHFKGTGLLTASGDKWRHNRRFSLLTLRDFGMGKQAIQYRVQEETEHFLDAIDDQKGKPFDIKALLTNAVANVICAILFGRRYDYNDADFCDLVKWITENASGASFVAYSRFAKYIPGDPMHVRRSVRNTKSLSGFYKRVIEEHRNQVDGDSKRSFIDAYITEMNKEGNSENMNIDSLVRIVHEIFMAGTDTTAVTLRWALLYQMRNPDIQKTLHDEVDSVVPRDRLPELHDKAQLPILSATILETMRLSNILPLNVPHGTKYDTFFHGYDIPKNAVIIPSLMSVLSDDTLWDGDADIFCPFRFLENGDSMKKIAEFIPFSLGRRACLGEALAKTEVFLFLSAMLQRFTFLPPDGEDPPKPERVFATVTEPKSFLLRAVRRT